MKRARPKTGARKKKTGARARGRPRRLLTPEEKVARLAARREARRRARDAAALATVLGIYADLATHPPGEQVHSRYVARWGRDELTCPLVEALADVVTALLEAATTGLLADAMVVRALDHVQRLALE